MPSPSAEPQPTRKEKTDDQSEFRAFDKGIDRNSPRTAIKAGGYEDAVNILLLGSGSGKHPTSILLDSELDAAVTWPAGNPQWCAPFSYPSYNATTQLLSFTAQLVIARAGGHYHSYISGAPGTVANVRRVASTTGTSANVWQINHFIYDKWLCTVDGRNAPMKYGQHFFDDDGYILPYMFPIGSRPISPIIGDVTGETWSFTGTSEMVADASVPGGGSRVGTHSLKVGPNDNAEVTFTTARDFITGPAPYASRNFVDADSMQVQSFKSASAGGFSIHFYKTFNTVYRAFVYPSPPTGTWSLNSLTMATTGSTVQDIGGFADADMGAITTVGFYSADATNDTYLDDLYMLYSDAPPAAQVGVAHKDRIVLGGAPLIGTVPSLGTIIYSNAEAPDNFATGGVNNTQAISGGAESLAKVNQITALREYQDSVIVGTPSAIFAWTVGATGNPAKSTVSTEHGIDSQRGVIETPNGALLFPWQRGIYVLRATGRQFIGAKIQPFLADITTEDMSWTMAVLDEKTKTVRYWFR